MNKYVVGFAFSEKADAVLLVKKLRPEWQKGHLNGVGGKIEEGETPAEAMNRECFEETGLSLPWRHKGVMTGMNNDGQKFECHIFYAYDQSIFFYEQKEDEPLSIYDPSLVSEYPTINNLQYLVPLGMANDRVNFLRLEY